MFMVRRQRVASLSLGRVASNNADSVSTFWGVNSSDDSEDDSGEPPKGDTPSGPSQSFSPDEWALESSIDWSQIPDDPDTLSLIHI